MRGPKAYRQHGGKPLPKKPQERAGQPPKKKWVYNIRAKIGGCVQQPPFSVLTSTGHPNSLAKGTILGWPVVLWPEEPLSFPRYHHQTDSYPEPRIQRAYS